MSTTHRAPPSAKLAAIEAFVRENRDTYHFPVTPISTELLLALVQFAMAHGAVTVGDLTPGKLNAG